MNDWQEYPLPQDYREDIYVGAAPVAPETMLTRDTADGFRLTAALWGTGAAQTPYNLAVYCAPNAEGDAAGRYPTYMELVDAVDALGLLSGALMALPPFEVGPGLPEPVPHGALEVRQMGARSDSPAGRRYTLTAAGSPANGGGILSGPRLEG